MTKLVRDLPIIEMPELLDCAISVLAGLEDLSREEVLQSLQTMRDMQLEMND